MPLAIQCPKCSKRYQVADAAAGKQVRCQQCQTAFVASATPLAAAAPAPLAPPDPFAASDPLGRANPLGSPNPLGTLPAAPTSGYYPAAPRPALGGVSNPSGGPTDAMMRLVSGGMLAMGVFITVGSIALLAATDSVYLFVVALAPLCIILGIAGLIDPNVVRAVGKYGGHLGWHYKAIGYALMGLYLVILILMLIAFFALGFQPDRPGMR
jgi:predicted Zn finger-like uncharacterized protein